MAVQGWQDSVLKTAAMEKFQKLSNDFYDLIPNRFNTLCWWLNLRRACGLGVMTSP